MGDFTCSLLNSKRDSGLYPTITYKTGKHDFYAVDQGVENESFYMIYDQEKNGRAKWINRTEREVSFDPYIIPI